MSSDPHAELGLDPDAPSQTEGSAGRPAHLRLDLVTLVAIGGFLGALARYGFSLWEPTRSGHWPTGTFVVNVAGSFILGVLVEGLARAGPDDGWRQRARMLIGTGFCGALTTYSTLAVESDLLVRDHRSGLAVAYLLVSVVSGLIATTTGIVTATGHHRWRVARRGVA